MFTEQASIGPVGLTSEQALHLLELFGPNEVGHRPASHWQILARQFRGTIFWLLTLAALVSAALGEIIEACAMVGILVVNAFVAFGQELHAERSLRELYAASEHRARVKRDGRATRVPASQVVPGDMLLLEPGDLVAADATVRESDGLTVDEAELTGDVEPVPKSASISSNSREARVLMGTVVVGGRGAAEVVATGARTELGKMAKLASPEKRLTPLQRHLDKVGRALVTFCVGVVLLVATIELARGVHAGHVLLLSLSLAVASLPESLGAMVTIALTAVGRKLSRENVVVRRLDAVETLGSTTLVSIGKSGTLTSTELVVKETCGRSREELLGAAVAAAADQSATLDPVERAIEKIARPAKLPLSSPPVRVAAEQRWPDAAGSCSAVRRGDDWYVRGSPEAVLPYCRPDTVRIEGQLSGTGDSDLTREALAMRDRGLFVLAVARGPSPSSPFECVGLLGLSEQPRPRTKEAISAARRAGIRVVMMTADHEREARAVAEEVGLVPTASELVSGGPHAAPRGCAPAHPAPADPELVLWDVEPDRKLEHVRRWQEAGEVVAVMGDRMNDAPAVREANIGIAMGNPGSDVTCEAADMILLDDDFSHLVVALTRGRGVYRSIRKSLVYVLAGNLAELLIMLVAAALGWPEPLLPVQLLWINLLTDSLPAFALVLDPPDADVLDHPPRRQSEPMLGRKEWTTIGVVGLLQAALALLVFRVVGVSGQLTRARALCLSIVVFGEVFWALALSSRRARFPWLSNATLLLVIVGSALVQAGLAIAPIRNALTQALHLEPVDVALALAIGLVPFGAVRVHAIITGRSQSSRNCHSRMLVGPHGTG